MIGRKERVGPIQSRTETYPLAAVKQRANGKWPQSTELGLVPCDNSEGRDGVGGGREVQERGDVCIPVADSCWCVLETSTTLCSNYPPIKIN